jgi:hypothetical protein
LEDSKMSRVVFSPIAKREHNSEAANSVIERKRKAIDRARSLQSMARRLDRF